MWLRSSCPAYKPATREVSPFRKLLIPFRAATAETQPGLAGQIHARPCVNAQIFRGISGEEMAPPRSATGAGCRHLRDDRSGTLLGELDQERQRRAVLLVGVRLDGILMKGGRHEAGQAPDFALEPTRAGDARAGVQHVQVARAQVFEGDRPPEHLVLGGAGEIGKSMLWNVRSLSQGTRRCGPPAPRCR